MAEDTSYQPGTYRKQGGNELVIETDGDGRIWLDEACTVGLFVKAGAPVDGVSGTQAGVAGKGSLLIDSTNGNLYINTNTLASPTWTIVGNQS